MNKYQRMKQLCEELKGIAARYNVTLITAQQVRKPESCRLTSVPFGDMMRPIVIDHLSFIK